MNERQLPGPVVLFDGICNLCSRSVDFILQRDRKCMIHFASLQSTVGAELRRRFEIAETVDSLVLIDTGRAYVESTAALRIARLLRWPWPALAVLLVIPRPIRDWAYRIIARHRYRWFGKRDSCRAPTPQWRDRFLE